MYKETKKDIHYFDSGSILNDNVINSTDTYFPEAEFAYAQPVYQLTGSVDGTAITDGDNHYFMDYLGAINAKGGRETIRLRNGIVYGSVSKLALVNAQDKFQVSPESYLHLDIYVVQQKQSSSTTNDGLMFGDWKQYKPYDVYKPLNAGCWQYVKVLKHKHIVLKSNDVNEKAFKIKYTPYYKTISSTKIGSFEQFIRGVYVVYRLYATSSYSAFYGTTSTGEVSVHNAKTFNYPVEFSIRQYFTV
jgi:hypothetical protein